MNGRNEPEMKTDLEMNRGLEMNKTVEMNTKHITKNNPKQITRDDTMKYTEEELIKKIEAIPDLKIREELLKIIKEESQYIDINQAKKEIQKGYVGYISGAKFITSEDKNIVLHTIKKDLMVHKNACSFIVRDYIIDLMLDNNATLYSYYFLNPDVLKEVLVELPTFKLPILKE